MKMKRITHVLITALACAFTGSSAAADVLADERWRSRVFLVFFSDADAVAELAEILEANKDALTERAVKVGWIPPDGTARFGDDELTSKDAAALRALFNPEDYDFRFVLIGKDGGIKRDNDAPPLLVDVLDQIDAMPMRQREMRSSNKKSKRD